MPRLAALSNVALADGFRLAGIPTVTVEPARIEDALRSVLEDDDLGLLLVTRDLWDGLTERTRQAIERLPHPIVQAVPAGEISEAGARRALLGEMLERAIGYRIELGGEQP